jgi:hypothetical protein
MRACVQCRTCSFQGLTEPSGKLTLILDATLTVMVRPSSVPTVCPLRHTTFCRMPGNAIPMQSCGDICASPSNPDERPLTTGAHPHCHSHSSTRAVLQLYPALYVYRTLKTGSRLRFVVLGNGRRQSSGATSSPQKRHVMKAALRLLHAQTQPCWPVCM